MASWESGRLERFKSATVDIVYCITKDTLKLCFVSIVHSILMTITVMEGNTLGKVVCEVSYGKGS